MSAHQVRRRRRRPPRPVESRPRARRPERRRRWPRTPVLVGIGLAALLGVLIGFNLANRGLPAAPDNAGLHQDLVQGNSGAEVTFDATVVSRPIDSGGHERLEVSDPSGDRLELDYNLDLGSWIPVTEGSRLVVHGQLYIDPGPRYGVHCLHAHTSRGCPLPGWIQFRGKLYQ